MINWNVVGEYRKIMTNWNIIGERPRKFCLFTSCDPKYLRDHARAYISSCAKAGNNVHLHVINASVNDWTYMQILKIGYKHMYPSGEMTVSSEDTDLSSISQEQKRTYYACNRFIVASSVITQPMLITDIDCLIMKHIDPLETDLGIFLREPLPGVNDWEREGSRVAAGAVFVKETAKDFLESVAQIILDNELRWFLDQTALSISYQHFKNKYSWFAFGTDFMDWEFLPNTTIWTGKGDRKYNNPKYLGMKNYCYDAFPELSKEYWL